MVDPNTSLAQPSQQDYLQVIAEVSQTINSILDLDQLLTRVSELIRTKFNIPYVHIFLKQYVPHTLEYRAGSGARAKTYHEHQIAFNLDAPQGLITLAARTGKVQLVNDVSTDPRPVPNPITGAKVGSELALPLIFGGRILGVLDLQSEAINAFSEAIEQDADLVIMLYRAAYYGEQYVNVGHEEISAQGIGELSISKHRNGETGTIFWTHNDSLTRIGNYPSTDYETLTAV